MRKDREAEQEDIWAAAESVRRKGSTPTSSRQGKIPLRLASRPRPLFSPMKVRDIEEIHPNLRGALKLLCHGELPWPLYIFGPPGTGKTCAALCLLDYAGGLYFTPQILCQDLLAASKEQLQTEGGRKLTPRSIWAEIASTKLLVLDELGTRGKATDWQYECVKRSIDEREGKPFVAMSNLDLDTLATIYDDRVASRLAAGTALHLDGNDRRLLR